MLRFALYLVPYLVIGYDILIKAAKSIKNRQVFDENFLMAVATLGAIGVALYEQSGDYTEAIAVMLFYQIGELFQSYAVGKSRRNISELMDIRPDYANIEVNGKLEKVDPDEVEIGSTIIVQPGEKVPLDGIVLEGSSNLNTSALTGESLPREVKQGDEIISGCINMSGLLKIQTTREFGESTVSKILDLVENASSRKSRSETFISRFAKVYTPAVCAAALALAVLVPLGRMLAGADANWTDWVYRALSFLVVSCPCALVISIPLSFFAGIGGASREGVLIKGSNYLEALSAAKVEDFISKFARVYTPAVCISALALAVLPPVFRMLVMGAAPMWSQWIYRALTFLVISCPCALVISIPLSFFAGIGGASREGVLVKGSNYLETLSQTKCVVFDKTGTLTQGVFEVNGIHHSNIHEDQLVEYAALAESASSHPISKSLQRAYGKELDRSRVTNVQEISGNGVIATVDGMEIAAGNDKLMDRLNVQYISCHQVGTIIHMAIDGKYAGHIVISDIVKPHAKEAIESLHRAGVDKTVMLTGDARSCPAGCRRTWYRRILQRTAAGRQGQQGRAAAGKASGKSQTGICGRWHQRCTGALPRRHRYCHGCDGLGCCD